MQVSCFHSPCTAKFGVFIVLCAIVDNWLLRLSTAAQDDLCQLIDFILKVLLAE